MGFLVFQPLDADFYAISVLKRNIRVSVPCHKRFGFCHKSFLENG